MKRDRGRIAGQEIGMSIQMYRMCVCASNCTSYNRLEDRIFIHGATPSMERIHPELTDAH